MHLQHLLGSLVAATASASPAQPKCPPFPSSAVEFSAGFQQPIPPLIQSEFNTSFVQHKWNQELSHITAGHIVNSPTRKLVRVDEAYEGGLASSLFNYANVTDGGLVDNTLTTFGGASPDQITVWRGFVNSNFPLFSADLLAQTGAVFGGLVARDLIRGQVASVGPSTAQPLQLLTMLACQWNILYQGVIPVTVYVDACNVVAGYDYFSPDLRTRVINLFFNTRVANASLSL